LARLSPALENWRDAASEAFLRAYRDTVGEHRLLPQDADHADRLIRFFLLEKALYEIEYELANQPNWLHVPLEGMLRILRKTEGGTETPDA
jgi:maltose alpha-D-glucosyltransferase/alpha-amylase